MRASSWLALCAIAATLSGCGTREPPAPEAPPTMRRLSEAQYRNVVADVFGRHVVVAGSFDALPREAGLAAVGAASASITASGFERFDRLARSIAAQVTGPGSRDTLVGCGPADPATFDRACAEAFLGRAGRLLYRRALAGDEIAAKVASAQVATADTGDFHAGLAQALAGMLVSPNFLYVTDDVEPDPQHPGRLRLTGYAKASRLSFLLWNSAPDERLLEAAERGALHERRTLGQEVDRLMSSPRLGAGVEAFFADLLALEDFEVLEKDAEIYPNFTPQAAEAAREQLLRTIEDHVLAKDGDYRDLFTTRATFMNAEVARVYRLPVADPDAWSPYELPEDSGRAGLLTLAGFAAQHAHAGRSSPTRRGKAVRELLLCQKVPDPPSNIDFSKFNDPKSGIATARERLAAHNELASCAGCHKLTDPIGLALEHYDGAGQFRDTENGRRIDTSAEVEGTAVTDAVTLGAALREAPALTSCLVDRLFSYATARRRTAREAEWLRYLAERFESGGYRLRPLLRTLATSEGFFAVKASAAPAAAEPGAGRQAMAIRPATARLEEMQR